MSGRPSGIVTLMTDKGTVDGYAAAMKGALLTRFPRAVIVDITHHVPNRDVTEAAFQLAMVWPVFPAGTVHLVVVDPGDGQIYRPVAIEISGHYFVVPDNGLLTLVLASELPQRAVVLDRDTWFRGEPAGTFVGRDLFAPVAGVLASGEARLDEVGSWIAPDSLIRLPWAPVVDSSERVRAPVVSVDRFGNCRTLITRRHLPGDLSKALVRCGDITVRGVHRSYNDVALGKTLALFGSHGGLEIAVRGGSAAQSWELSRGDEVVVTRAAGADPR